MSATHASIATLLKQSKLRRTPVRAGVLEVLTRSSRPLGAIEILEKLPPHTDAVTVYRTLNTFTKKSVTHRVRGEDRTWRYALGSEHPAATPHYHPHFVCDSCGKVECLKDSTLPKNFLSTLHLNSQYAISYPELILHGTCPKCR